MYEEKDLKKEGEELARVAVDSGMGARQLQTIYKLVKTRPLVYVEAYVQRQIGRDVKGYIGFVKVLELIRKFEGDKRALEKVLMYAVMLYEYYEKEPVIKLKSSGEPVIRQVVERLGYVFDKVAMKLHGKTLEVNVSVSGFHGNPKVLAIEIERALKTREEFSSLNLKVWIESR